MPGRACAAMRGGRCGAGAPALRRHALAEGGASFKRKGVQTAGFAALPHGLPEGWGAGPPSARLRGALPCRGEIWPGGVLSLSGGCFPGALCRRAASPAACACRTSLFPGCRPPAPACAGQCCAASFPSRAGTFSCGSHAANTARLCFPPAVHACAAMRCQCGVRGDRTGAALCPAVGLVRRVLPRRRVAFQ